MSQNNYFTISFDMSEPRRKISISIIIFSFNRTQCDQKVGQFNFSYKVEWTDKRQIYMDYILGNFKLYNKIAMMGFHVLDKNKHTNSQIYPLTLK